MKTAPRRNDAPPAPPRRRHTLRNLFLGVLILLLLVAGGGVWYYKYLEGKIKKGNISDRQVSNLVPEDPGGAINFLVIGSDTRVGLDKQEQSEPAFYRTSGQRSDTIIFVHLFGDGKHAVVMSIPRDLRANVPGFGVTKINAAYNLGPNNVIKAVEELTGLPVNHYIEVNFVAFRKIVDALGGVTLCVSHPYNDPDAGFFVKKAGCYNFNGNQALGYARTRKEDPRGDFDRIDHQQQLIRVMLSKATSLGTLFNPLQLTKVADAVGTTLKHDAGVNLSLIYGLAKRLKGASTKAGGNPNVDFRIVPSHPQYIGGISYVIADSDASQLYAAIKADKWPLPDIPASKTAASIPQPSDVSVRVVNASGDAAKARAVWDLLKKQGFNVFTNIKTAPAQPHTDIFFQPGDELKVQLIDNLLLDGTVRDYSKAETDVDVTIYVGQDGAIGTPSPSG